ncbi:FAD-dependent monooxygenase [Streptomyces sp. NPDC048473]|uniref:FAD-dependent monooxygenase n=1 Tax=unclassified Streptomyces TaxID=2593676 RepID=UPI003720C4A9
MSDYLASKVDACVVGAGPHGLALAKALLDAGHSVAVVDRETDRSGKRQTMLIQPGAIKVLDSLGVREAVEADTHRLDGYDYYVDGDRIAALRYADIEDCPFAYGLGVPYRVMQHAFLDELLKHPGFQIFDGAVVGSLLKDAYGTLNGVAFTQGGTERVLECRLVVAADGEGSPTRDLAGISVQPAAWDYEAITFLAPRPDDWPSVLSNYRASDNRYLGLAAYSPDEVSVLWGIRSGSFDEVKAQGFETFLERILSVEPRLRPSLKGLRGWEDVRHHTFPGHIADTWVADGVLLIGSTAHSLTTFGGQNMNLALYDAQSAARTAARALAENDLSAGSLAEYEKERRPLVENIAKFQTQAAAPDTDGSGGPAAQAVAAGLQQMFRSMALGPSAWQTAPATSAAGASRGPGAFDPSMIPTEIYRFDFRYDAALNWAWKKAPKNDPVMTEIGMYAWEKNVPIIGPLSGRLLWQLAKMSGAKRVFEFGSAVGFSTIWLARAVGPEGKVYYTESDPVLAAKAVSFIEKAGVSDRVEILVGDAMESFRSVEGDFDLILCDIDKRLYPEVFAVALPRLVSGGLFVADNIFWNGDALTGYTRDPMGKAIGETVDAMLAEESLFTTLIPLGDGLAVGYKE